MSYHGDDGKQKCLNEEDLQGPTEPAPEHLPSLPSSPSATPGSGAAPPPDVSAAATEKDSGKLKEAKDHATTTATTSTATTTALTPAHTGCANDSEDEDDIFSAADPQHPDGVSAASQWTPGPSPEVGGGLLEVVRKAAAEEAETAPAGVECCVCFGETSTLTACGHALCSSCEELLFQPRCPVCRGRLPDLPEGVGRREADWEGLNHLEADLRRIMERVFEARAAGAEVVQITHGEEARAAEVGRGALRRGEFDVRWLDAAPAPRQEAPSAPVPWRLILGFFASVMLSAIMAFATRPGEDTFKAMQMDRYYSTDDRWSSAAATAQMEAAGLGFLPVITDRSFEGKVVKTRYSDHKIFSLATVELSVAMKAGETPQPGGGVQAYKVGDDVKVWSYSKHAWYRGQVTKVKYSIEKGDLVSVRYMAPSGQLKKDLSAQSKDLKPAGSQERASEKKGKPGKDYPNKEYFHRYVGAFGVWMPLPYLPQPGHKPGNHGVGLCVLSKCVCVPELSTTSTKGKAEKKAGGSSCMRFKAGKSAALNAVWVPNIAFFSLWQFSGLANWMELNASFSVMNLRMGRLWVLLSAPFSHQGYGEAFAFGYKSGVIVDLWESESVSYLVFFLLYIGGCWSSWLFRTLYRYLSGMFGTFHILERGSAGGLVAAWVFLARSNPELRVNLTGMVELSIWHALLAGAASDIYFGLAAGSGFKIIGLEVVSILASCGFGWLVFDAYNMHA